MQKYHWDSFITLHQTYNFLFNPLPCCQTSQKSDKQKSYLLASTKQLICKTFKFQTSTTNKIMYKLSLMIMGSLPIKPNNQLEVFIPKLMVEWNLYLACLGSAKLASSSTTMGRKNQLFCFQLMIESIQIILKKNRLCSTLKIGKLSVLKT